MARWAFETHRRVQASRTSAEDTLHGWHVYHDLTGRAQGARDPFRPFPRKEGSAFCDVCVTFP